MAGEVGVAVPIGSMLGSGVPIGVRVISMLGSGVVEGVGVRVTSARAVAVAL